MTSHIFNKDVPTSPETGTPRADLRLPTGEPYSVSIQENFHGGLSFQAAQCLASTAPWVQSPPMHKLGVGVQTCNPVTQEVEAGNQKVQNYPHDEA